MARLSAYAQWKKSLFPYFVLPALCIYVVILIVPTFATAILSFMHWNGAGDYPKFIGLHNYTNLLWNLGKDTAFSQALWTTLLYTVIGGIGTFMLAFLFAMVLREMRGNKIIRAILFFPNIIAPIAIGMFFGIIFALQPPGLVNAFLHDIGIPALPFLSHDNVQWVVLFAIMWAASGLYITIFMSAIDRIPPSLYEDAALAGASSWQKFRYITLPMLASVVSIAGVLWVISAVKIFEIIWVLAGPGTYAPPEKTWTLGVFVYARTFGSTGSSEFGVAAAIAMIMLFLVIALVLLLRRVFRVESIEFT